MPVIYNSKKIIPAPFVSIRKEYHAAGDGRVVGTQFVLTLQGTLVAEKGSPNSSGTFHTTSGYPADEDLTSDEKFKSLLTKQQALMTLFATEGATFEVQAADGTAPLKCNPRIRGGVDVPQGQWIEQAPYTIVLEADELIISGTMDEGDPSDYKVQSADEEWNLEILNEDQGTYRLTHSVSAQGKRYYDETGGLVQEAWENARDYVISKIGLGLKPARLEANAVLGLETAQAYNYQRSQVVNEYGGGFSVTESWLCFDPGDEPPAINEYTVTTRISEAERTTVSIDGQVTGFEVRDNNDYGLTSSKWTNASSKWETHVEPYLKDWAQTLSGVTLNAQLLGKTVGQNQTTGVITYSAEFDNRPTPTVSGALSQRVSVGYSNPADVFSRLVILGRPSGPLMQDINTSTGQKRSVNVEVQMPAANQDGVSNKPNTDALVLAYKPSATTLFVESDEEQWDEDSGRYSRNVVYAWE